MSHCHLECHIFYTFHKVYFARACILAIYGDQPAATKCSLTGSACLVCFGQQRHFAAPPAEGTTQKRTPANMKRRRDILNAMCNTGQAAARERAGKRAKRIGVSLDVVCGWTGGHAHEWVFGPCPAQDNIYQCLPQVNLHGMDEGLIQKLNYGALELLIATGLSEFNRNATQVHTTHDDEIDAN
jgi:hypothetical protein